MAVLITKDFMYEISLCSCKISRSPHSPTKILDIAIEDLPGSSHVFTPDGINISYSLKAVFLRQHLDVGWWAEGAFQGCRIYVEPPIAQSSVQVNLQSHPLDNLLQQWLVPLGNKGISYIIFNKISHVSRLVSYTLLKSSKYFTNGECQMFRCDI